MGLIVGFTTIIAVICCGMALAHTGILDHASQRTLGEIAFFVASPALMVETISQVHFAHIGPNLAASAAALLTAFTIYLLLARLRWRHETGPALVGALASSYANVGNLGIATAAYIVGDVTVVVPTLLVQIAVLQPLALAILDHVTGRGTGAVHTVRRVVTNPLTIASAVGVLLALTRWQLPELVAAPLHLIAGAAIPLMLISYGAALRLSPLPGRTGQVREVATAVVLKLALMPVLATLVALGFGLDGTALLGVVLTAALPTAQNIFLHATRYEVGEDVARETILVTTLLSLPIAFGIALVLG